MSADALALGHQLPRLSTGTKLLLSVALVIGWGLFLSAWVAGALVSGWGFSWSILLGLGALLEGFHKTIPLGFWVFFGLHAASIPLINTVALFMVRRIAMPRGFRTTMRTTAVVLGLLDIACWLLLPYTAVARALLASVLVAETAVLALLVVLPFRDMWVYSRWKSGDGPKRVLIVGGGFGGLYTALSLDKRLGYHPDLEITVVDKKNYFLFPPLLPSVATGAIEARQVTNPFRRIFEATNVVFKKQCVEQVDLDNQCVHTRIAVAADPETGELTEERATLAYDYLVLAPGASTNTFGVPGAEKHAFFMRELGDALAVRNRVIDSFEHAASERDPARRKQFVRFIVVGAGPTGVELAAEVQDLIHNILLARYPEIPPDEPKVYLVQSGNRVLPGWHDMVAEKTAGQLGHIAVEKIMGNRVVEVRSDRIVMKNGDEIEGRTVVWCTGVKPASVMSRTGLTQGHGGRIPVRPCLRPEGHDNVFVLGDVAECADPKSDRPLPALAQVALQQGGQTGPNIIRLLKGREPKPFKYLNYGALICVGEHFAVVDMMGVRFSGFIAWIVWRLLYLAKLVGFGNRVRVVLDWTLDLLLERSISQLWTSREEVQLIPDAQAEEITT
jgi:NADH dehydrogenase